MEQRITGPSGDSSTMRATEHKPMNILLVSPATPDTFWGFKHALPFVGKKAAYPPLGLLTVAAMLPRNWQLKLADLNVAKLTEAEIEWADYVLLSAMIVQERSAREVAARCAARGKPVLAGGPLFTTGHQRFPEIPHFVLGEAENIMPALLADMAAGHLQPIYQHPDKPDVCRTPVPRWDLIEIEDYASMLVQFSRGCPFDCEFCDIVAMYGRLPRVKTPAQICTELDALIDAGWRSPIFIVDDNFIGHKAKVKELLRVLIRWRARRKVRIPFIAEASLNLVDDKELLELMVVAGLKKVFIGLETPDENSLTECAKVQNTARDMVAAVKEIQNAGIEVMGGFIVGFDSDSASIFERQWRFIQEVGVVTAMVGLLNALPQTRLYARLKQEGRLLSESTGNNLDAVLNFVPKLDRATLINGYRALVKRLYSPKAYYRRALTFLRQHRKRGPRMRRPWSDLSALLSSVWVVGVRTRGRREYWKYFAKTLLLYPRSFGQAMQLAIIGYHFRKVAASL
jgi:radical SAM superfamily enzyme YgiQ (UPF0313 family)